VTNGQLNAEKGMLIYGETAPFVGEEGLKIKYTSAAGATLSSINVGIAGKPFTFLGYPMIFQSAQSGLIMASFYDTGCYILCFLCTVQCFNRFLYGFLCLFVCAPEFLLAVCCFVFHTLYSVYRLRLIALVSLVMASGRPRLSLAMQIAFQILLLLLNTCFLLHIQMHRFYKD